MNLRIAKKVLKDPDRYSAQQRYHAAHRIYHWASTFKDGEVGFMALQLKPQKTFHEDDQLDLRYEYFLKAFDSLEEIDFPPGEIVIQPEAVKRPAFRRDGQAQNFNAIPWPGKFHYKQETVVAGNEVHVINQAVSDDTEESKRNWVMGEWRVARKDSRKKYQVREARVAGMRPPRLKRRDYGLSDLLVRSSYR